LDSKSSGEQEPPVYSIGGVARMLDMPASTLRAWEERYGMITPARSEGSQRLYSRSEVERLRFIKAQVDSGATAADAHRMLAQALRAGGLSAILPGRPDERRPLVLLAEQDLYAARLAEYFLRTEGYDMAIARDATQALLQFDERSPDVVVIDLLISGGAGFRLVADFAQQGVAQVIAVAAINGAEEALRRGAAAFMLKPLESLQLVSTIKDLLRTSAILRPHSAKPAEL
jgi:DNA-binding transcriptional MerR regulator